MVLRVAVVTGILLPLGWFTTEPRSMAPRSSVGREVWMGTGRESYIRFRKALCGCNATAREEWPGSPPDRNGWETTAGTKTRWRNSHVLFPWRTNLEAGAGHSAQLIGGSECGSHSFPFIHQKNSVMYCGPRYGLRTTGPTLFLTCSIP